MSSVLPRSLPAPSQRLLLSLFGLIFSTLSIADNAEEQQEINNLLQLLQQQTTLATNTRLNADFVPGIINIMTGEEMRRKGFVNLWQAMAFMPGVQRTIDATGLRNLTIRGISQSIGSGKIKLLLNNVTLNSSSSTSSGTLFDTPVNQIERVEFIRGPGSAIHGEFAFAGVINVLTKKNGDQYSAGLGSNESANLQLLKSFSSSSDLVQGSFNISAFQANGEDLNSGPDRTITGITGYAPGQVNNKLDSISAILDLQVFDYDVIFQYQQSNRGDHFGFNNYLPPPAKQTIISDTATTLQITRSYEISELLTANWSLTHVNNHSEKNRQFLGVAETFGGTAADDDIVSNVDIQEQRNEARVGLIYQWNKHKIFSQFSYSDISVDKYQQFVNLDPATLLPDSILNEFPTPIRRGQSRTDSGLVLQDEYDFDDDRTITVGLRYDYYDDIGDHVSPRIAFVWRMSRQDIFKIQYAEAFRPPNLLEFNGAINGSIDPEIIRTAELSYIYDESNLQIKNTLYSSEIEDLIAFQNFAPFGYGNFDTARISGYEIELSKKAGDKWNIAANLSYQYSDHESNALRLYELAPWLFSTSIDYQHTADTSLNLLLQIIPEAGRENGDAREDLSSRIISDISFTQHSPMGLDGLTLTATIKNITAEEIKFASPINTYASDYIISDSPSLWIELTYRPE